MLTGRERGVCIKAEVIALALLLASSTAVAICAGDCNFDGEVTVDELIVGVNIALGSTGVDQCYAIDLNGDREVTIDEIVRAVNVTLIGCPPPVARLVALSRKGQIASLDIAAPW